MEHKDTNTMCKCGTPLKLKVSDSGGLPGAVIEKCIIVEAKSIDIKQKPMQHKVEGIETDESN